MYSGPDGQFFILQAKLGFGCKPNCIHGTMKHDEQTIANFFHNLATMGFYNWKNNFALLLEQLHGEQFVFGHLLGVANDVGKNDGS
jgi:hypothetical protein